MQFETDTVRYVDCAEKIVDEINKRETDGWEVKLITPLKYVGADQHLLVTYERDKEEEDGVHMGFYGPTFTVQEAHLSGQSKVNIAPEKFSGVVVWGEGTSNA
jgi:hypothetical protein